MNHRGLDDWGGRVGLDEGDDIEGSIFCGSALLMTVIRLRSHHFPGCNSGFRRIISGRKGVTPEAATTSYRCQP